MPGTTILLVIFSVPSGTCPCVDETLKATKRLPATSNRSSVRSISFSLLRVFTTAFFQRTEKQTHFVAKRMAFESCQHTVREIVLANFEKRRYWTLVQCEVIAVGPGVWRNMVIPPQPGRSMISKSSSLRRYGCATFHRSRKSSFIGATNGSSGEFFSFEASASCGNHSSRCGNGNDMPAALTA